MGTLGSGRYAPYAQRPHGRFVHHVEGHKQIKPDSIVYTDSFRAYDVLDVSDFHHVRINHSKIFAEDRNHINGIENFWNQAKPYQARAFNKVE